MAVVLGGTPFHGCVVLPLLLPIDRLLDVFRTMVNLKGHMIGRLGVQKRPKG
jgi:Na+/H+-dicarboxylate symporter